MGLSPDVLWTMTPREWRAAVAGFAIRHGIGGGRGADGLSHAELDALIRRFPDG